jgi:hypothetical protein
MGFSLVANSPEFKTYQNSQQVAGGIGKDDVEETSLDAFKANYASSFYRNTAFGASQDVERHVNNAILAAQKAGVDTSSLGIQPNDPQALIESKINGWNPILGNPVENIAKERPDIPEGDLDRNIGGIVPLPGYTASRNLKWLQDNTQAINAAKAADPENKSLKTAADVSSDIAKEQKTILENQYLAEKNSNGWGKISGMLGNMAGFISDPYQAVAAFATSGGSLEATAGEDALKLSAKSLISKFGESAIENAGTLTTVGLLEDPATFTFRKKYGESNLSLGDVIKETMENGLGAGLTGGTLSVATPFAVEGAKAVSVGAHDIALNLLHLISNVPKDVATPAQRDAIEAASDIVGVNRLRPKNIDTLTHTQASYQAFQQLAHEDPVDVSNLFKKDGAPAAQSEPDALRPKDPMRLKPIENVNTDPEVNRTINDVDQSITDKDTVTERTINEDGEAVDKAIPARKVMDGLKANEDGHKAIAGCLRGSSE